MKWIDQKLIDTMREMQRLEPFLRRYEEMTRQGSAIAALAQELERRLGLPLEQVSQVIEAQQRLRFSESTIRALEMQAEILQRRQSGWFENVLAVASANHAYMDMLEKMLPGEISIDIANRLLSAFQSSPVVEMFARLQRRARVAVAKRLVQLGWFFTLSLPVDSLADLVENKKAPAEKIHSTILAFFRKNRHRNLSRMIRSWYSNKYFKARQPIFAQALKAHKNGQYYCSISTLLPQIEGIATDFLVVNKGTIASVVQALKSKNKTISDAKAKLEMALELGLDVSELEEALLRNGLITFLTTIAYLPNLKAGVPVPQKRSFNRHTILHGSNTRFGNERNSLRCFLLLDALYSLKW